MKMIYYGVKEINEWGQGCFSGLIIIWIGADEQGGFMPPFLI